MCHNTNRAKEALGDEAQSASLLPFCDGVVRAQRHHSRQGVVSLGTAQAEQIAV